MSYLVRMVIGEIDANGAPYTIEGYERLSGIAASTDANLTKYRFGEEESPIFIRPDLSVGQFKQLYIYNPADNTFTSQKTGLVYKDVKGTWINSKNQKIIPGYTAGVGLTTLCNS